MGVGLGGVFIKRTWNKKYMLIDMIDAKTVDVGTFKELSENNRIDIDRIKWSYYQDVMVDGRYLVVDKS